MIPIADLKKQYHSIKAEIDEAVSCVLESSQFILGPEVAAFEKEFAGYSGTVHGIGVNSGTSALHLALLAAGVGPGDEVITTPFTFVASVAAIRYTGARPVFVDIDPATFNLDPALIEAAITPRTKAIMPVHLYGQCADMDPILDIARRHGKRVIEDAAQAHGAEYKGRRAGSMGDMACFSFYPGKNLGAYGEGGMVVTANEEYASSVRLMRSWGESTRYYHDIPGYNYRMEGLQGAILRVKLRHLDGWTAVRRERSAALTSLLRDSNVRPPEEAPWAGHVYHCYVIRTTRRQDLMDHLAGAGIQTAIHYPIPVHLQRAHLDLGYKPGDFPRAEKAAAEVLSLPMNGDLTQNEIETIGDAIVNYLPAEASSFRAPPRMSVMA